MSRFLKVGSNFLLGAGGGSLVKPAPSLEVALISGDLYEGNSATFRVSLTHPWLADITVTYATSNGTASAGTDYTSTSGTVDIVAGEPFVDLTVPTTLRAGSQSSRTFTLTISAAVDAAGDAITRTTSAVTATILDTASAPELPTLSIAAVAPADEGDPLTFRVTASFAPTEDITFSYATSNGTATAGTDYTAASGTATLSAATLTENIAVTTALRAGFQGARTVVLTISDAETASSDPVTIAGATATGTIAETEALTGAHGRFETMIARADYLIGASFRPVPGQPKTYPSGIHAGKLNPYYENQLLAKAPGGAGTGGYFDSTTLPPAATYSPGTDTDPHAQDAAKFIIDTFYAIPSYTLQAPLNIGDTSVNLGLGVSVDSRTSLLVGTEVITLLTGKTKAVATVAVSRGQFSTTEANHASGATLRQSTNSIVNEWKLQFPTPVSSGQSVLFQWDAYYTDSYCRKPGLGELTSAWLKNHKAFQFTSKTTAAGSIWSEPATRFTAPSNAPSPNPSFDNTTHIAQFDFRSYNALSSETVFDPANPGLHPASVTTRYPVRPMASAEIIHANRWHTWYVHFDLRPDDYDLMNVWVADEVTDPVHIFQDIATKAWQPGVPNGSIQAFWVELNTSDFERFRLDDRQFVCYIRNFVGNEIDIADVPALLEKPE